jgi:hypothetical protein
LKDGFRKYAITGSWNKIHICDSKNIIKTLQGTEFDVLTLMTCGMLCHKVWMKFISVSEKLAASIFMVKE